MKSVSQVIVLDLDDTLYLERDFVRSGFSAAGKWLQAERGTASFPEIAWRLFQSGRRGDIFNAALSEAGVNADQQLVDQLVEIYRNHLPQIALQPDSARFLANRPANCGFAILTDGHLSTQQNKIKALGLNDIGIYPIVCTGLWGREYWKPHQRGYLHIAAHYENLPSSCFTYIADNPAKDFFTPRALGWRTVQIIREGAVHSAENPDPADLTITSLDEVAAEWFMATPARALTAG